MQFVMLFLGALMICSMMSNKEGRAAARRRQRPYTLAVGGITAAVVAVIVLMG